VATTAQEGKQQGGAVARQPRQRKRSVRLAEAADTSRERNNFDMLRLFAATCVIFGHSFDLLHVREPFPNLGGDLTWGFVGVLIFFSISGFLVSRSWARNPRILPFALKRTLRLMPALLVAVLLSALVLGPLLSTEPLHVYLRDPATKAYVLQNAELQTNYTLPGVFAHNAYPTAVNGSLWTLPLEVKAYVFLLLVGLVGLLTRWRRAMPILAAIAVVVCATAVRPSLPLANHFGALLVDIQSAPGLLHLVSVGSYNVYLELFAAFVVGAALYSVRDWVFLRWDLAALAVAGIVVAGIVGGPWPDLACVTLAPYLVLCLAYRTAAYVRLPPWFGDYSYGVYVYAFPVQQVISQLVTPHSGWVLFVLAMPVTFGLAVLSWHFVERPALDLKTRLTGGERPAGEADIAGAVAGSGGSEVGIRVGS
jgi:peptidoglycan/LPS O-acetylase OafA/YrhL